MGGDSPRDDLLLLLADLAELVEQTVSLLHTVLLLLDLLLRRQIVGPIGCGS